MNTIVWMLIITVYSGGAMGGVIGHKEAEFKTLEECKIVKDMITVEQSSTLANGDNTHTVVITCLPKSKEN